VSKSKIFAPHLSSKATLIDMTNLATRPEMEGLRRRHTLRRYDARVVSSTGGEQREDE